MSHVSFVQLLEKKHSKLQLRRLIHGADFPVSYYEIETADKEIVGHFNLIRPNWIEVLGLPELEQLALLDGVQRQAQFQRFTSNSTACLIIAGVPDAPDDLQALARQYQIPLFVTPLNSVYLMWMIRHYLFRDLTGTTTRHGVFLDVLGVGVMITGDSGVGKSELGLELIARGNGLISDDVVELHRIAPETIDGTCPELLRDVIEVRGLGILNIRTMFGETAVRRKKSLKLIVHLHRPVGGDLSTIDRLPLEPKYQQILGVSIRTVDIPVVAGRNLAVLVEAAVRNFVMQQRGIDSMQAFIARHDELPAID